ncbi:hypothetical protein BJ085DRAFT_21696 [Dimargaris cristalligena]|uniref:cytochrome-b5 reductase n=1 Tax=Dimargaris cristalligena TaxID=215637 RepID=A0A4P9ZM10_9FUNG|nr:hypothetical protein BJ085DRAFT_21696 [Dimargaris cristalligena]|eukprot:RKP34185.1 hypothetical protein BJ085DRAFT_21696 [Dimargaris cristalligena]
MASAARASLRFRGPIARLSQVVLGGGLLGYGYYGIYAPWADPRKVPNELDPDYFRPFTLIDRRELTSNTALLRFRFRPTPAIPCIPTVGAVDVKDPNIQVKRPFTPIHTQWVHADLQLPSPNEPSRPASGPTDFELLVKRYPHASVSQVLHHTSVGDTAEIRGPIMHWPYQPNRWGHIAMIAGGTGITPMFQLLETILTNPNDRTRISLIFSNRTERDIPLQAELEKIQARYPERFQLTLTIDRRPSDPYVGLLSRDFLVSRLPPAKQDDAIVLVSGPPGMMKNVCGERTTDWEQGPVTGILRELGYTGVNVHKF